MNHALIRLREELRALRSNLAEARAGAPEDAALAPQIQREISETREAIAVLQAAQQEVAAAKVAFRFPGRVVRNDWDAALFEPWSARKARRGERRVA